MLHDIAIRVAPLTNFDANEMLDELKARAMLDGVRGLGPVQKSALIDILIKISHMAIHHSERIAELDINPLIIKDDGQSLFAVDVLVKAKPAL